MPPRYITVPFLGSGNPIPITTPTLTATTVSSSEIDLAAAYTSPPVPVNYNFEISTAGPLGPWPTVITQSSPNLQVTGLTVSTTYWFRARVLVADGRFSAYSSTIAASTLNQAPDQVTGLVSSNETPTSITLAWNASARASTYNVYVNGSLTQSGLTTLTSVVTGLASSTQYTFTVSASNSSGEGSQSAPVIDTTKSSSTTKVKWNPGHYAESNTVIFHGQTITRIQSELNSINNLDNIQGFIALITWSAIETSQDVYDFTVLDSIFNFLKTGLNKPKRFGIIVEVGAFNGTNPGTNDVSILPAYLQGNVATYGQAGIGIHSGTTLNVTQPSGVSGWWGGNGNGNTYAACLWRPSIMARFIKLHQAIGAHYDSDPMFECIMFGENSFYIGAGTTNGVPDYSDAAMTTQSQNLIQSTVAAFPTTSVVFENTFLFTAPPTYALTKYLLQNRCAIGQTDTLGLTHGNHSWGMAEYIGQVPGDPDWRPTDRSMIEVQATDMGFFGQFSYTPQDILNAGQSLYQSSHMFWAIVPSNISGTQSPAANWPALGVFLNNPNNALVHTTYPGNYP